ncbi:MAG: rhomboid family intramembrane serine protease [Hydrotalea sp.]|nr:rhomboid family intramembrane serine protease [Hydrotalea sp.]
MTEFRPSRFEILPVIIKNLVIINGLFFLAQNSLSQTGSMFSLEDYFALHAWQSQLFKPWQLLTHMFMHGSFWHLFGNMFALWMFGSVLENLWGSKRFLTFYIICGLGAALIHLLFLNYEIGGLMRDYSALLNQHKEGEISISEFNRVTSYYNLKLNTATLGASGAVFGVLAAFVYLFPNTYIYLYFLVPIKAKWLGLGYFAFEVFYALKNSAGDNVARWAHIGGAIVGLILVLTWNKTNRKSFF